MKKIISILISLCLIFGMTTVVFAAASVSCSVSTSSVLPGNSFKLTVSAKDVGAIKSIGLTPSYDSAVFEITKTSCLLSGAALAKFDGKNAAIAFSDAVTPSGKIYEFTFKVKDGAKVGSYTIKVSGSFKNDSKGTSASGSGSVKITVSCNHKYGSWTKVSDPTCTKAGSEQRTCSLCGNTETRSISALGHKYGSWSVKTEPTCTKAGEKVRKCSVCGAEEKTSVKALGHELQDPTVTVEATCTSHGQATGLCTRCGQVAAMETPFAEHSFGEWTETKAPSCTEKGVKTHSCQVCGFEASESSLPLGHHFEVKEVIQHATIYSEGISEAICANCGEAQRVTTPCMEKNEATGLLFEADCDVFADGTQILAEILSPADGEEGIYTKYAISFEKEEEAVQPTGSFQITFPIPDGYGRNISVNLLDGEGNSREIPCIINLYDNTVKINADAAGTYQLTDIDKVPPVYEGLSPLMKANFVIGGLGFTTLLFLILFITKKPKPKAEGKPDAQNDTEIETKPKE